MIVGLALVSVSLSAARVAAQAPRPYVPRGPLEWAKWKGMLIAAAAKLSTLPPGSLKRTWLETGFNVLLKQDKELGQKRSQLEKLRAKYGSGQEPTEADKKEMAALSARCWQLRQFQEDGLALLKKIRKLKPPGGTTKPPKPPRPPKPPKPPKPPTPAATATIVGRWLHGSGLEVYIDGRTVFTGTIRKAPQFWSQCQRGTTIFRSVRPDRKKPGEYTGSIRTRRTRKGVEEWDRKGRFVVTGDAMVTYYRAKGGPERGLDGWQRVRGKDPLGGREFYLLHSYRTDLHKFVRGRKGSPAPSHRIGLAPKLRYLDLKDVETGRLKHLRGGKAERDFDPYRFSRAYGSSRVYGDGHVCLFKIECNNQVRYRLIKYRKYPDEGWLYGTALFMGVGDGVHRVGVTIVSDEGFTLKQHFRIAVKAKEPWKDFDAKMAAQKATLDRARESYRKAKPASKGFYAHRLIREIQMRRGYVGQLATCTPSAILALLDELMKIDDETGGKYAASWDVLRKTLLTCEDVGTEDALSFAQRVLAKLEARKTPALARQMVGAYGRMAGLAITAKNDVDAAKAYLSKLIAYKEAAGEYKKVPQLKDRDLKRFPVQLTIQAGK